MQKYKKYLNFLSENFQFLEIKFSIYLNRRVFVLDLTRTKGVVMYIALSVQRTFGVSGYCIH